MKVFIAFGYNSRDQWIRELVYPMVEAFGGEVITGENLYGTGMTITKGVIDRIESSDALLGFTTRRIDDFLADQKPPVFWPTHQWVRDELVIAHTKIPIAEIRENGVDPQCGILADLQRISYEEGNRDKCLVQIAKILGKWRSSLSLELKLLPSEMVTVVRPLIQIKDAVHCFYQFRIGSRNFQEIETEIYPVSGNLYINLRRIPEQARVRVRVEASKRRWCSDFEPIEGLSINVDEVKAASIF